MPKTVFETMTKNLMRSVTDEETSIKEQFRQFLQKELKMRQAWERASFICVMFKEGFQWVNDEGVPDARDPNLLRRQKNKFKSTLRGLRNQITFNDPHIDVIPKNGEQASDNELDLARIICRSESDFAENGDGLRAMVKTMVDDAANKTFSMVSVMPNNNEDDPQINDIQSHDPFDVFFDNKNMAKAQIVSISSYENRKHLQSKGFNIPNSVPSAAKPSHSALKNEFENLHGQDSDYAQDMVLIDHVYYLKHKENTDGEIEKTDKPSVWQVVLAGDEVIRKPEQLKGYHSMAQLFFLLYLEKDKHIKYPMPWMFDVVPLQRSLNDASENIDTLAHWYAKVRLMQRSGSSNTIQLVGDRHAQKIRYSGERPEFMQHPTIPAELFRIKGERERDIEDQVGVHASSMGRASSDRSSGRREAILAAGDSDNVAEPVTNLEVVLSKIFAQVLENAADNVTKATKFHDSDNNELIGIGASVQATSKNKKTKNSKGEDVTATEIKPFKNIKVTIIPGSQMQIAQGRNEIIEVMQTLQGAEENADQRKALMDILIEKYSVGMARDISKAMEREQVEQESEDADFHIIRLEIEKLSRGERVTATPEQPHEAHIEMKMLALQQIGETEGPIFDTFMENIELHDSMLNVNAQQSKATDAFTGVTAR